MYPEDRGHGDEICEMLTTVLDYHDYMLDVVGFNYRNFKYPDQLIYNISDEVKEKNLFDFTQKYFANWFSDYLYIKNLSGHPLTCTVADENGQPYQAVLKNNGIGILNFGRLADINVPECADCKHLVNNFVKLPKKATCNN